MKKEPVVGKTYEISYIGYYEYDHYKGKGVFTGNTEDIDGMCYEFTLPDGKNCFFPLDSVFRAWFYDVYS